jgi:protein gp37
MNAIGWCEETCNPVAGCSPVSPACDHCWAEGMTRRLIKMGSAGYVPGLLNEAGRWSGAHVFRPEQLAKLTTWRRPRRVFMVDMGDLFHERIPWQWVRDVYEGMAKAPWHTYLVLTKRPAVMAEFFERAGDLVCVANPTYTLEEFVRVRMRVWHGVTVENQEAAEGRLPVLMRIPGLTFVSCEPLLGRLDIAGWLCDWDHGVRGLMQVIAGGESGPGSRPSKPEWFRALRDDCAAADVPFYFKGWGDWLPVSQGAEDTRGLLPDTPAGQDLFYRVGKKKAGRMLDGREHLELR